MEQITETPNRTDWATLLIAEQLVFGLLGKILFEYPQAEFFQTLVDEKVFEDIPMGGDQPDVIAGLSLVNHWGQTYQVRETGELFDDLVIDYNRLFIGPGKVVAPPWESMYFHKERIFFQEETLQVREWYRRFGLESVKLHNEPDDHIGLELAFIAHLAGLGLATLEEQEQAKFEEYLDAQRQFILEHPLKWVAEWAILVEENSKTDFFIGIAKITRGLFAEISSILGI
jgi:TorA maturation chaperone TorD